MDPGAIIREARRRNGVTQRSLAIRAGTTQAAISRIERGLVSPSVDTLNRLLLVMGEEFGEVEVRRIDADVDIYQVMDLRNMTNESRLKTAINWNLVASKLFEAGRRAGLHNRHRDAG